MTSILRYGLLIAALCVTTTCCFPSRHQTNARLPKVHVNDKGWFTDESRRVLMFHGVNSVVKEFPWYSVDMLNDTVLEYYREWGFNVIRLGTMWSGVEPQANVYNDTYIKVLQTIVAKLESKGIYTFLDMHQDVMAKKFGTYDGFPTWLVEMLPKSKHPYPWPFPASEVRSWAENYLTEACCVAFQGFYDNVNGTLTQFAKFWTKISTSFRSMTSVLAYELINEPWPGDVLLDPSLFLPGNAGRRNLMPAYDMLHKAIRSVDDDTIIFFEPVTWGVIFNGKLTGTGFDHVPGGPAYRNRTALSYHMYCWLITPADKHKPFPTWKKIICDDFWGKKLFDTAVADIKSLRTGGLLTEFGECQPDKSKNSTDTIECEHVLLLTDQHLQSWTYWDVIFFTPEGHIQWDIAKPFIRTYARAVAGTPLSIFYDVTTHVFLFTYALDTSIKAPTEIFVPRLHNPNGFSVAVSDGMGWVYDSKSFVVRVKPVKSMPDYSTVYVRITPR